MHFLGLGLSDRVPDAKTVWLFNRFAAILRNAGYLPMSGEILDATLVAAPKQRNTNAEKADLREGRIPQEWHHTASNLLKTQTERDPKNRQSEPKYINQRFFDSSKSSIIRSF